VVPEVREAIKLKDVRLSAMSIVAHPYTSSSISDVALHQQDLDIFNGPEGGFAQEEIDFLVSKGVAPVRLGARILRAETAPIALIAALLLPEGL
jgi:16S rRNA (uracil1498-N3)-methyltransferase